MSIQVPFEAPQNKKHLIRTQNVAIPNSHTAIRIMWVRTIFHFQIFMISVGAPLSTPTPTVASMRWLRIRNDMPMRKWIEYYFAEQNAESATDVRTLTFGCLPNYKSSIEPTLAATPTNCDSAECQAFGMQRHFTRKSFARRYSAICDIPYIIYYAFAVQLQMACTLRPIQIHRRRRWRTCSHRQCIDSFSFESNTCHMAEEQRRIHSQPHILRARFRDRRFPQFMVWIKRKNDFYKSDRNIDIRNKKKKIEMAHFHSKLKRHFVNHEALNGIECTEYHREHRKLVFFRMFV